MDGYYPHFTDKEMEALCRKVNLPKVTASGAIMT